MTIKLFSIKSLLKYSETFNEEKDDFILSIEKELGENISFAPIDDYDCDLKLIFVETGGSEGLFLSAIDKLKEPYYLLTSGGNNSLAASFEIMTWIKLNNRSGEIIHGDSKYIANKIKELALTQAVKKKLNGSKLGVIGTPSDWLISSVPNYKEVKEKLGIDLVDISLDEIKTLSRESNLNTVGIDDGKFEKKEIEKASSVYFAIDKIVKREGLSGLTIRCFDLLEPLKTTGCLSLSKLNDIGIIGACEGDIMAMITMYIVSIVSSSPSFQSNPSRIYTDKNEIVFAHCTIPTKMLDSYYLDTHFESGIGVAIKGTLHKGKVTVFRMSSNLKDYYVESGEIVECLSEKNLCRTQIRVKMDGRVDRLLTNPCGNHHIIFHGDYKKIIDLLMKNILN